MFREEEDTEPAAKRAAVDLSMLAELEGLEEEEPLATMETGDMAPHKQSLCVAPVDGHGDEEELMSDDDETMVMCEGKAVSTQLT